MTEFKKNTLLIVLSVITLGAIVNGVTYQFTPHYSGPITATSVFLLCTFILLKKQERWSEFGLRKMDRPVKLIWQVPLVFVVTVFAGVFANYVFSSLFGAPVASQDRFEGIEGNLLLFLLWSALGWIVGGFFEEMIFRGFFLGHFEKIFGNAKWSTFLAICAQAFLFGLVHYYNRGIVGGSTIFIVGITIGLLYVKLGRNLWPLILAHGIVDTLSFLEDYLGA